MDMHTENGHMHKDKDKDTDTDKDMNTAIYKETITDINLDTDMHGTDLEIDMT
jgi:hypothetical protein